MNKDVQELYDWTLTCLSWADKDVRKRLQEKIDALRSRLSTVGCWIPCDEQNPPPTEISDGTMLIVYVQAYPNYPRGGAYLESGARVVVDTWVGMGKLGHDITHYMLIEEPS